jgi:hypothetical protein
MKSALLLAPILIASVGSTSFALSPEFVVASNMTDAQVNTNAWEEIGLIAPNYKDYNNVSKGQSFLSQSNGMLTTIDALVAAGLTSPSPDSPPLNVSMYSSSDGIPVTRLGTLTISATAFAPLLGHSNHRVTFDFSPLDINLESGQEYLIAFETPFGINGHNGGDSPFFAGWSPSSLAGSHAISLGRNLSFAADGTVWQESSFYSE